MIRVQRFRWVLGLAAVVPLWLAVSSSAPPPVGAVRGFHHFVSFDDSGDHSAAISLGDVNGDGKLDVVLSTGRHWESPIHLYFGDGKGGFTPAGDIGNQGYASYGVPLADLNGDGRLDLAVATDSGGEKPIFFGDGKGHFRLAGSFGDRSMPARNIAIGDLNGDGLPDIAIANRGTQSYVYLNDGKGGFTRGQAFGGPNDSTVTVAIADINGDGKPDLIVARRDGQQSVALINDGRANFSDPRPFGPADADTRAAAAGDLNGDGFPDIVACHLSQGTYVYLNDGHGNFRQAAKVAGAEDGFYSLAVADMNRDGRADIAGGNTGRANAVFFNRGNGTEFQRVDFGESDGSIATYGLAIADIDGDGFPDIAVARSGASSGIFFSTAPDAPRSSRSVAPAIPAPPTPFSIRIGVHTADNAAQRSGPDMFAMNAANWQTLIALSYGVPLYRVAGDVTDQNKYDVSMQFGKADRNGAWETLRQALRATLRVTITREPRETPALILKPLSGKTASFTEHTGEASRISSGTQGITLLGQPMSAFVMQLEAWSNQAVIDETGLTGKYDIKFHWEGLRREALPAEITRQLGMATAIERRAVEFLVVKGR